jgi:cardiolipin synthase
MRSTSAVHESSQAATDHGWRNIPNAISLTRLFATPVLLGTVLYRRQELFTWLLLACLLSDILDGLIARTFNLRSKLGASLDSIADMLVCLIGVAGIFRFQSEFLAIYYREVLVVLGLYAAEVLAALVRYGKISSFHTVLNRVAAYAQGIFVMSLFLWGYRGWIFQPMIVLTVLAYSEELVLVYLLPEWRNDVRGVYWVLFHREGVSS